MFDIPTLAQFPVGVALGVASVVAPWLLRPFIIVGLCLLGLQAGLLYAAGGTSAVAAGLQWFAGIVGSFVMVLTGIALGRVVSQVLFGR
jgi:hypothetical protein